MNLTCPEHIARAAYHREAGEALHAAAGHQWAAVCYFYSAFHLARAALSTDPVFDDWDALGRIDSRLIPEDRYASRHQMRRGSEREFGVNDLIELLHDPVADSYIELHGASNAVRYGTGTSTPVDDLKSELDAVEAHLIGHERLSSLKIVAKRL